jgi:potassium/sodium efflux P-type ATPase
MIAKKVWIPACGTYSVDNSNNPVDPESGDIRFSSTQNDENEASEEESSKDVPVSAPQDLVNENTHLKAFLDVATLANLSTVFKDKDGAWRARGDPTETAINVFATRFGWNRTAMTTGDNAAWKTCLEFPFDSDVKKMSVILENTDTDDLHIFTKGAVERVVDSCSEFYTGDTQDPARMTDEVRERIYAQMEEFASYGLRVLALASRPAPNHINYEKEVDRNEIEKELTFRGLIGLYDPPRAESAASVRECRAAGIEVHMLTGDHPGTARAIAIEVGILPSREKMANLSKDMADSLVIVASDFDKMSDSQIDQLPQLPLVVARCAPNTKVRMIEALHRRKKFAAMVRLSRHVLSHSSLTRLPDRRRCQ